MTSDSVTRDLFNVRSEDAGTAESLVTVSQLKNVRYTDAQHHRDRTAWEAAGGPQRACCTVATAATSAECFWVLVSYHDI